jgi:hypothetical protein
MSQTVKLISAVSMLAFQATSIAQAQVTIDAAKVSCDQYTSYNIKSPEEIAIWLHGFYSGKRNQTLIDTEGFRKEAKKLWDYCVRKPNIPVMNAVEALFKPDSK